MSKKSKKYPLSNNDIYKLVDGKVRILPYSELANYDDIDKVLGYHEAAVILYETKNNFGHWTLIFKNEDGKTIEHFDSYGLFPDDELKFVPENFRKENNEYYPILTYLLMKSPYKKVYNNHRLQEKDNDVNTCGRHVVSRLIYRDLDIDDYFKMIKISGLKPDEFVLKLTNNI